MDKIDLEKENPLLYKYIQDKKKESRQKIYIIIGIIIAIIIIINIASNDKSSSSSSTPTLHTVEYVISGTARYASLTYSNMEGGTEQIDEVSLPHNITYTGSGGKGIFVYISAQNQSSYGSVTVEIKVDGRTIKYSTSSGEYVIASASDRISF